MNVDEIRELYDQQLRRDYVHPGSIKESFPNLVRMVQRDGSGFINYSKLNEGNADRLISEQIEFFRGRGVEFEWKYFSHDTPADLKERLAAKGFEIGEDEAILVLDAKRAPANLLAPIQHDVRPVTTVEEWNRVFPVIKGAHGLELDWLREEHVQTLTDYPDRLGIFAGYANGEPVCLGWSFYNVGTSFVGLYGGGTLPEYRHQGFYTALVAARLQEALRLGFRFLTIDAGPESEPILKRMGAVQIAVSNPCTYPAPSKE